MTTTTQKPIAAVPANPQHVKALRSFNRFYTQRIGVLAPYLGSKFTLTELRVLYELAHQAVGLTPPLTASSLATSLALDAGYLSRILRKFEQHQWLARSAAPSDARQSLLRLTELGYAVFAPLQQQSRDDAATLLGALPSHQQQELVSAMQAIERLLQPAAKPESKPAENPKGSIALRAPQPGDMGWVVQQHGEIYTREYGWNDQFEALVATIVAAYLRNFEPQWERCWIAELGGERVGSVFVVRKSKTVAQLRMLILTPAARGQGLGARLLDEAIAFARSKGYKTMQLWTNACLDAARALYAKRGFTLLSSEAFEGFGKSHVSETWRLKL